MSYLASGVDGGCLLVFLRSWHDIGEGAAPPWLRGSVCGAPKPPPSPDGSGAHALGCEWGGCQACVIGRGGAGLSAKA